MELSLQHGHKCGERMQMLLYLERGNVTLQLDTTVSSCYPYWWGIIAVVL